MNQTQSTTPIQPFDVRGGPAWEIAPGSPRQPELLSPAGDWACARAAVENGADAIYFGLDRHNARLRANNFTARDLPQLMDFLHGRGVRGYACFNTLIFAHEMAEAGQCLRSMISAGVDAILVQDIGICRLIRQWSPDVPIHASTQMTITSAAGVELARELGCSLVVLARECSLKDIARLQATLTERGTQLPLEVFIHGALCVAYSGQCLTSEALGGRSANRGVCAQACRMPYELVCDGHVMPLGDRRYLLSPQDLAGLEVLPDLIHLGVASLKIEGRLKTPEYVASITRIYRQALDRIANLRSVSGAVKADAVGCPSEAAGHASRWPIASLDELTRSLSAATRYDMEMAFSRGLHTGWFHGINNQELIHARFGKKRGVFLGVICRVQGQRVILSLQGPLKAGDGVVFDAGRPEEAEEGGRVYTVQMHSDKAALSFGQGDIDFGRLHVGDKVWKTSDPDLERRLRRSYSAGAPQFRRPITIEAHGRIGQPLRLVLRDELGHVVEAVSAMSLSRAEKQALTSDRLQEQLGRLGGTAFRLETLRNHLESNVMLPVSELNRLRRQMVAHLESLRVQPNRWTLYEHPKRDTPGKTSAAQTADPLPHSDASEPNLAVLIRDLAQLDAVLCDGVETLYCEFEDPKNYREAVRRFRGHQTGLRKPSTGVRSSQDPTSYGIFAAPPRIFKPGERWILEQIRSCGADGYLMRNYDHLRFFTTGQRIGDYSLNITNELTAGYFVHSCKLQRVTASYDLNTKELEGLLRAAPAHWFEITLHQHMPMFHMEHCVFCAFLSLGTDYTNCARPCDRHKVALRDRVGAHHRVLADAGCRNTVFNALAQTGAEAVPRLRALGARWFRLEFLDETPDQVQRILATYHKLLRNEISGTRVSQELRLINQVGITRGPKPSTYQG